MSSATPLTLLTLPHELILQICKYALPGTFAVSKSLCQHAGQRHRPHRIHRGRLKTKIPALYTCRLLNQLTSSVLYTTPAYHMHVAAPSIRWQSWDRHTQSSLLSSHGGKLRKVMLFVELHRGGLCCSGHCPEPGNFSRGNCVPRRRMTQGAAIYLCADQLKQIVSALLRHRERKIEELVVAWDMSPWIVGHEQRIAKTVLASLGGLRGWVADITFAFPGFENKDWVFDLLTDLVLKEKV